MPSVQAPTSRAPDSAAYGPLWLKVLVILMGLLIIAGFIVIAAEIARRMSTSNVGRPPASAFAQRIALPSGGQVLSMSAVGDRLVVHVRTPDGMSTAYIVDPRTGTLLGTIDFPPGAAH